MTTNGIRGRKRGSKPLRIAIKLGISLLIAVVLNLIITSFAETPKMSKLQEERHRMEDRFSILRQKIATAQQSISEVILRDQQVYRPLLDIDTLHIPEVYAEYNSSKYSSLSDDALYGDEILQAWQEMDRLTRLTYYASLCLDETQQLAENKEEFSLVIPAIWPIDRTKLRRISSSYGSRLHPKLGYRRMHEGIDLAAPTGTDVYATGDAVVVKAGWEYGGYGRFIELNHGFGYRTRYAHLYKIFVNVGDSVRRGETIGQVGSSGVSTGPHLHYEVRYRGNHVNPINYFNKDMDTVAYRDLMEQITQDNDNGQ